MVLRGTVRNGVVVLEEGSLAEGTAVRIEPLQNAGPPRPGKGVSSLFRAADRARDTGIPDLAINHDHYLYGHPKVTDG